MPIPPSVLIQPPAAPSPVPQSDPLPEVVGDIDGFLQEMVAQMEPTFTAADQHGPGSTTRILPSMVLWAGLLVCVLHGFRSQLELWRLLSRSTFWHYPRFAISDKAVYGRLERGGIAGLQQLFAQIRTVLAQRLAPYAQTTLAPFASEVVALDETTLDQVARLLPARPGTQRETMRRLPGKLSVRFDLRRQQFDQVEYQPSPHQNEKVAARHLLEGLARGSLILADLGYFGFRWFDDLTDAGHFWISRLRAKTSYEVIHVFYQDGATWDGLVWLGKYRADRAKHAVRLVRFAVGKQAFAYVTNVCDPQRLSLAEIARLYARRWDIELAFLTIKRHLGLSLLWSTKDTVILQQVWAVLIIAQVLQALRLEIAGKAGVDLFEVSLSLLIRYAPIYAAQGQNPVAAFVEHGREMGFIRPSSRTVIQAPEIPPEQRLPLPPEVVLERPPRYGERRCEPVHPAQQKVG
ncbi:MAG: hypothetical protein NVS2B16_36650 [Chloroflexota bacterium]